MSSDESPKIDQVRSLNSIIEENFLAKVHDVFSYFDNVVQVKCNFDTLLDYYNK